MKYILDHESQDSNARAGRIYTDHGTIQTPIFMPVGTQASVKTLSPRQLNECHVDIILNNTYHLYLRPGTKLIEKFGGVQKFMSWKKPVLTDSGGFQVFSLQEFRKIEEDGVFFRSHLDGSSHHFTPENIVDIQRSLGSDIMMVLDECTPHPSDYDYARDSMERTIRWAKRAIEHYNKSESRYGFHQALFAINQGNIYPDLRKASTVALCELDFPGYAIGGLAVGENENERNEMVEVSCGLYPKNKPRYLMGVGKPRDILEGIERGVDMFDCVLPTRNARNGMAFTSTGPLTIRNASHREDHQPLDNKCACYTCQNFSRGYIRHLFSVGEILALNLTSLHNIHFYLNLVRRAREAILKDQFLVFKQNFLEKYINGNQ